MFLGVLRLVLHLPDPGSLKSKRHLLRSAIDRVKGKFNVSIAEVGDNDLWQRSVVGVAAVGNDHAFVNETLDKVADFVASMHGGQILVTDRAIEITSYGDDGGEWTTLAEAEMRAQAQPGEAAPERAGGMGGPKRSGGPTIQNAGWRDEDDP
jgi:uncharacterized protein YlxP (DUF503 family)